MTHVSIVAREDSQTWRFRGSKSRNKVTVGEPAVGSLTICDELVAKSFDNPLVSVAAMITIVAVTVKGALACLPCFAPNMSVARSR